MSAPATETSDPLGEVLRRLRRFTLALFLLQVLALGSGTLLTPGVAAEVAGAPARRLFASVLGLLFLLVLLLPLLRGRVFLRGLGHPLRDDEDLVEDLLRELSARVRVRVGAATAAGLFATTAWLLLGDPPWLFGSLFALVLLPTVTPSRTRARTFLRAWHRRRRRRDARGGDGTGREGAGGPK